MEEERALYWYLQDIELCVEAIFHVSDPNEHAAALRRLQLSHVTL